MFRDDRSASPAHSHDRPKGAPGRAGRPSRPLSLGQEVAFLGVVFAAGLLLNLAVILKMSAIIG